MRVSTYDRTEAGEGVRGERCSHWGAGQVRLEEALAEELKGKQAGGNVEGQPSDTRHRASSLP